ncbi:hypothetical protein FQN57_006297 [Myotisia sp. PD_48]|nr:hypothetical protein FQN57_006297 [Myotisia sp. PD_48]
MGLKVYGSVYSTNTQRVVLVLNLKKIPFEYIEVDLSKGEHKAEEFMKQQPFGAVPYIDDDGFVLFESRAICNYIETKYPNQGPTLIPTDLKANARYNQGLSIEVTSFEAYAAPLLYEKLFKTYEGLPADEHLVETYERKLTRTLDVYEKILSKQKYLGGDQLTLADLYHLPILSLFPAISFNAVNERLAVAQWAQTLLDTPEWKAILSDGPKSTA